MIYDNLVFMAEADTTGVVVGAGVLIVLSGYCRGALLVGRAALLYEDPLARDPDRVLSETAE